jgi:hypothetical protein
MNCNKHLPDALVPRRRNEVPDKRTDRDRPPDGLAPDLPAALSLRRPATRTEDGCQ